MDFKYAIIVERKGKRTEEHQFRTLAEALRFRDSVMRQHPSAKATYKKLDNDEQA